MRVSWHVGLTTPAAGAIALADPVGGALFWAGGVLIDSDHYLAHIWFNRSWNLREAYRWYFPFGDWIVRHPRHRFLCLFHTAEAIGAVAVATFYFPSLAWLLAGLCFHMVLDKLNDGWYGLFWARSATVTGWWLWARKQERLVPSMEEMRMEREAKSTKRESLLAAST